MRRYRKGRKSYGICQRTGFKVRYRNIIREPGTGLIIDKRMSDGRYNAVDHPQNCSARVGPDSVPLENATKDTAEPAATEIKVYIGGEEIVLSTPTSE